MDTQDKYTKYTRKDAIIDAAIVLFYENGIQKTSFDMIAEKCGATNPLVTYHFGTKNNLVRVVSEKIIGEKANYIDDKIYALGFSYDLKIVTMVDIMANLQSFYEDEKARNFFLEYLNCGYDAIVDDDYDMIIKKFDRFYQLDVNRNNDELGMVSVAVLFLPFAMQYAFYSDMLHCTIDEMIEYLLKLMYRIMHFSDDEINQIYDDAVALYKKLDLKTKPYFKIE